MVDDCEIVETVMKKSPSGGPPTKKLKQCRLPFSPVNSKSLKKSDADNKKKRKFSGNSDITSAIKTPRNESKQTDEVYNENLQTPKVINDPDDHISPKSNHSGSGMSKTPESKDGLLKKKGRPPGSKNKSSLKKTPQDDGKREHNDASPTVRKRGRPVASGKKAKSCFPDSKSLDTDEVTASYDDEVNGSEVEVTDVDCVKSENEENRDTNKRDVCAFEEEKKENCEDNEDKISLDNDDDNDLAHPLPNIEKREENGEEAQSLPNTEERAEENGNEKHSEKSVEEENGEKLNDSKNVHSKNDENSVVNETLISPVSKSMTRTSPESNITKSTYSNKKTDYDQDTTLDGSLKKCGRPKGSSKRHLTYEEENKPKRKKGRPPGSKNIIKGSKQNNLNHSLGSVTSDEESTCWMSNDDTSSKTKTSIEKTRSLLGLFSCNPSADDNPNLKKVSDCNKGNIAKYFFSGKTENRTTSSKSADIAESSSETTELLHRQEDRELEDNGEGKQNEGTKDREYENEFDNVNKTSKKTDVRQKENASVEGNKEEKVMKENEEDEDIEENKVKNNLEENKEEEAVKSKTDIVQSKGILDSSLSDMDVSHCESEVNTSQALTPGSSSDANDSSLGSCTKTPTSGGSKTKLFVKPKKLTPKQREKEAARKLKMEERSKQKEAKEKLLQEKIAEKEKLKKQKEEEKKQKDEEKQKLKEEKEKAKEEMKKKKQEELEAKKLKKEEEQQRKEEERMKKEDEKQKKDEEQQRMEEEKRKQRDVLKMKFASFFVSKKKETDDDLKEYDGPFQEFQIKDDMQLAPIVRQKLTDDQYFELNEYLSGKQEDPFKTYLHNMKSETYVVRKSERTFPMKKMVVDDDDDIEIIDEEEEEDVGGVIPDPAVVQRNSKFLRAKLLSFCENQRPAYWGTWSKKSTSVSARRPFAKDEIFDYDYDSDDDWEEEEAGESLSDSEGDDKDEKEDEGDQYEVDNDFFVPHGYLSDDEGRSDQEEDNDDETSKEKEQSGRSKNTEHLKKKQAEFEEEMKKKTKELKPRVIGCLWMGDENNNPAYNQLMKILGPHRAVPLCSELPVRTRYNRDRASENKDVQLEDEHSADTKITTNSKLFVKIFPEEAIPALIKLLHGNRQSKSKLAREFSDYWRKLTGGELDESQINATPVPTPTGSSMFISKRKVDHKIQEIGVWKRHLDTSKSRHTMCWYVPKKIRELHGLSDLDVPNSWIYINKTARKEELNEDEMDSPKVGKIRPITAFTKKIPSSPLSTNSSPASSTSTTPQHDLKTEGMPDTGETPSKSTIDTPGLRNMFDSASKTPVSSNKKERFGTPDVLTGKHSHKKKVNLLPQKTPDSSDAKKGSIVSFFKKKEDSVLPSVLCDSDAVNDSKDTEMTMAELGDPDVIILE
ncbi:hypothetical protein SK128_009015 [Halocaridina rubra]|uniref:Chromatin assembly factor 1 subunit A n=1 Tax=Halocaridina rubra TaxID=373956 RepID=A0AAN9A3J4_HALRR